MRFRHRGVKRNGVYTVTVANQNHRRNEKHHPRSVARRHVVAATLAYKAALYAFADGHITWSELLGKCQAVRAAIRAERRQVAA
jgi:hypothetical protein